MNNSTVKLTLIGGPTILIETGGLRLLTDPTFDPPGSYQSGSITLQKTAGPALSVAKLGRIDAVLLSHDQHADNLDPAGRALLTDIPTVLTTRTGAQRLGGKTRGLVPWETIEINAAGGTRTPCHRNAGTPWPCRHRADCRRCRRLSAGQRKTGRLDLRNRRHRLVRGCRGGCPPLPATFGYSVCGLRQDARVVSSHHGQ